MCKDLTVNAIARDRRRPAAPGHAAAAGRRTDADRPGRHRQPAGRAGRHLLGPGRQQQRRRQLCRGRLRSPGLRRRGGRPLRATRAGLLEPGSRRRGRFALEAGRLESPPVHRPGHRRDRQRRQNDHAADDPRRAGPFAGRIGQPAQLQQSSGRAAEHVGHLPAARLRRAGAGGQRARARSAPWPNWSSPRSA